MIDKELFIGIKSSNIYMKSLRKSKQNKTRKSKSQRGGIGIPSGLLKAASGFASKAASSGLASKALSAAQKTPYGSLASNALGKAQESGLLDKGLNAFQQSGIMDKLQNAVPMQTNAPVENNVSMASVESPDAVVKEFAEASDFQKEKAQAAEAEEAKFKAEEDKFKAEKEKIEAQITLVNMQNQSLGQQGGSKRYHKKRGKRSTQKSKK
jgi:polyisoprenoid-binding protein YceI